MEGVKTIAFEIVAALGDAPDRVYVLVGGGGLLAGLWRGFEEARRLGWSARVWPILLRRRCMPMRGEPSEIPVETPIAEFSLEAVPPRTKRRLRLVIDRTPDGQTLSFPALVARGAPGKTLLVTGGVHGDEYEGPVAIQDVFAALDPQAMRGVFLGVPVTNGPAFAAATREGHWDHQNLARIFPGRPDGTLSERIAHAYATYLVPPADLLLDIHSGGNAYAIHPLAGYQIRPGDVGRIQRAAAVAFGLKFVWGTSALPGRSLSAAGDHGVPAIYVEMPGEGRCRPEDRVTTVRGIGNVLAFLGIIEEPVSSDVSPDVVETQEEGSGHLQVDHPSPTSGLFVPAVDVWTRVTEGQHLGEVRDPDGRVLAEVTAARNGRVLFLRTLPRVFAGDCLAFVLAGAPAGGEA